MDIFNATETRDIEKTRKFWMINFYVHKYVFQRHISSSDPSQMETSLSDLNSYGSNSNPNADSSLSDGSLPKKHEIKRTKDGLTVQV